MRKEVQIENQMVEDGSFPKVQLLPRDFKRKAFNTRKTNECQLINLA